MSPSSIIHLFLVFSFMDSVSIAVHSKLFHQKTLQKNTCLLPGELLLHTLCYGTCSISGQKMLQKVARTPTSCHWGHLQEACAQKSQHHLQGLLPPTPHQLFALLQSRGRYRSLQGVLGGADPPLVPAPAFSHLQLIPDNQLTLLHSLKDQLLLSLLAGLSLNCTCSRTGSCGPGCFNKRLLLPGSWVLVFDFAFVFCLDSACSTQ